MTRSLFIITGMLIAGLYVVRADRVGGMNTFIESLSELLDEEMIDGVVDVNERSVRLHRITLLLHEAEERRFDVNELIDLSLCHLSLPGGYSIAARHSLTRNLREAEDLGLFTEENRERILAGEAPVVSRGIFLGDRAQFRPLLEFWAAPGLFTNFLNMRYTVESKLDAKTRRLGREAVQLAHSFYCASLIDTGAFSGVIRNARG